ncbi:MAG: hypothetical protein IJV72_08370 [Clostridia bacterium]|nr:hypothetical protein [Clostridia bacterium]
MQAVLISIQPGWCELIASGKKTVEVRKTMPLLPTPFKAYIYETKDPHYENLGYCWEKGKCFEHAVGKVIGEFTCSSIKKFSVPYPAYFASMGYCATRLLVDAQLTKAQAHRYLKEKTGYAWRITDLKIYDKPKELREFVKYRADWGFRAGIGALTGLDCNEYITRPPQSWMYVEASNE